MTAKLLLSCFTLVVAFGSSAAVAQDAHVRADAERTFERDVRPILKAYCFDCHGAHAELKGGLDLRLRRFLVRGGDSGPALTPGKPQDSHLIERIKSGEMPPGEKKLPAADLVVLERWIADGAPTGGDEPQELAVGVQITDEERAFWSFQPIRRPDVPQFDASARVRTPIDALLLERLAEQELGFAPDADRLTLIRRAAFDLLGLPPSPQDVARFLADESPEAYERLIDQLLESPHYGERWGRHWLDLAGYADTEGYTNADATRPWAYKYRDYVIRAFNADKPFDQFIQEQLAGDEMVPPPSANLSADQIEKLTATGFLRMAADGTGSGANDEMARNQTMADTIKIVSSSLLGLSVGCAQCHDHRYDPISHADYYQLRAVFEPALDWKHWRTPQQRQVSLYTDVDRQQAAEVEAEAGRIATEKNQKQQQYIDEALAKELLKFDEPLREQLRVAYTTAADKRDADQQELLKKHPSVNISPGTLYQYNQQAADELKKFDEQIAEVRKKKPVEEFLRVLTEVPGQASETHIFHRGDFKQPTQAVTPAGLTITAAPGERLEIAVDDPSLPTSGRRLAYARWLTSGKHPLVARVLVNHVWLHHFGRGIVDTPSDFGVLGQRPTHPRLLDWLAAEFMAEGWSLKRLHKRIMLSTAYRQSSIAGPDALARDPDNTLYSKWPVQRLDAEAVRDRILAASGVLSAQQFGPPVAVKADDAGQVVVDGDDTRRSVYVQVKRTQPLAMLRAFDAPVMETNCDRRPSSTVATQALMLMNSDFILRHARTLAERARRDAKSEDVPAFAVELVKTFQFDSPWSYGHGRFDEASGQVQFSPLPHWTGSAWQGGPALPDPTLGWVLVRADGGHPGAQHAAIRRWTAPRDGTYAISGQLSHPSESGDGVRGRVVSSESGLLGDYVAQHGQAATAIERVVLRRGDMLDFVVDCRANENSDSFGWTVQIALVDEAGAAASRWDSPAQFQGPGNDSSLLAAQAALAWRLAYCREATEPEFRQALQFLDMQVQHLHAHGSPLKDVEPTLFALTSLCQVLLSSNEFLYVD